jgi:hypothetical protein
MRGAWMRCGGGILGGEDRLSGGAVAPEKAWYVIPVQAFAPRTPVWLYPRGEHAEAWGLLGAGVEIG